MRKNRRSTNTRKMHKYSNRNRRASDYPQEDQRDKQTQKVSSSFFKLRSSAVPRSLFKNGCPT